ncbi:MAG: hypothetical protein JXX14_13035 [Deltaproteobacteria bacterium]|nr:hypothetical protein [Deltaproteobacteria bacterium]
MVQPRVWAIVTVILIALLAGAAGAQNSGAAENADKAAAGSADGKVSSPAADKSAEKSKGGKKIQKQAQGKADSPPVSTVPPPPAENDGAQQADKGTYTVRLRDLEDRVNRLKEQIFRTKARLSLLAETVLEKKIAGAQANIAFRNEMGGSFRLHKASILLDGGPIFQETDESGSLSKRQHIDLFDGPVAPGDHTLEVVLQYKGHGYGIFSYLKGYTFKIKSNFTFTVEEGKAVKLQIIGFEKGDPTTPLEERPAVRYAEEFSEFDVLDENAAAAEGDE